MGIWAEIKHALNSTLGTEKFKPLDQLIKGQRSYVAGDELLVILSNSPDATYNSLPTIIPNVNFKPTVDGSVRVYASMYESRYNGGTTYFHIYEDGELILTLTAQGGNVSAARTIGKSADIIIKAGSVYTFGSSAAGTVGPAITQLSLLGHVVDLSMLEYNT